MTGPDSAHRARFILLRERVAEEMQRGSNRWRLTWILPIHFMIVGLLVLSGESATRAIIQVVCVAITAALFVARMFTANKALQVASFVLWVVTYFLLCGTTGGLASPLLVTLGLMMCAGSMSMQRPVWLRPLWVSMLIVGFAAMALLSHTTVGQMPSPLSASPLGLSAVHVTVALFAITVTMLGIFRMGITLTAGYERAALELAERRDQLCSENEDRTRALEGIAARLAHEVKNPLAAIKGLSTHMARNAADPKTAERLAIVAAEADRLQSIVDGFLSFSRGLDDLRIERTRPYEITRELGVLLETRAEEAGVSIEASGDQDLVLDADPRKLRQALLNVVLNAIQASSRGSTVRLSVARDFDGARLTVRDEGVGMTPEVLDRIRKPYFTTKEGGTGLGLAVARGLLEQHGGSMEFKSAPRSGTTVTIFLPMKAKCCDKLPFPLRSVPQLPVEKKAVDKDAPAVTEPVVAGVR